jgi:hypothetical protein
MAGIKCAVNSGAVSLTGTTAKTVLQLVAASNHRVVVQGFSVTVAGTSAIDLTVELLRQTSAGSGSSAALPYTLDADVSETLATSAISGCTSEPSADSPAKVVQYKKLQGSYEKYFPLGQELLLIGGARLGIRCTSVTDATVAAEFYFEE